MERRIAGIFAAALCLPGCASMALKSYVGRPVSALVERYGQPADQWKLPTGETAFRWVVSASGKPAATQPPDTFLPVDTAPLRQRETAYSAGVLLGGMCIYTVRARWNPDASDWRIVGYNQPRLDCN